MMMICDYYVNVVSKLSYHRYNAFNIIVLFEIHYHSVSMEWSFSMKDDSFESISGAEV